MWMCGMLTGIGQVYLSSLGTPGQVLVYNLSWVSLVTQAARYAVYRSSVKLEPHPTGVGKGELHLEKAQNQRPGLLAR